MSPSFTSPSKNVLFTHIKTTIKAIREQQEKTVEQRQNQELAQMITHKKIKDKFQVQNSLLKEELMLKTQQNEELKARIQDIEKQKNFEYKKQFRTLAENIGEKETKIQVLTKEIARMKNRIVSLEADIMAYASAKQTLQNSIIKAIEQLKIQIKELKSSSQQNQLDIMVFSTKYRQALDKLQLMSNVQIEIENKRQSNQEKYQKLRKQYTQLSQKNIELSLQIEKMREGMHRVNLRSQTQIQSIMSKKSLAKDKLHAQNYGSSDVYLIKAIQETITSLKSENYYIQQLEKKIQNFQQKQRQQDSLFKQVIELKSQNHKLMNQLNEFKMGMNSMFADQLLFKDHPKLYQFFSQKMNHVKQFQKKLQFIEKEMFRAMEMIEKIATEGIFNHKQFNSHIEMQEREKEIRNKITKQIENKINAQHENVKASTQDYYLQKIRFLEGEVQNIKNEKQQLENIVFKEKHSQNVQTSQNFLANKIVDTQSSKSHSETHIIQHQQHMTSSSKSKDKQLISYLQTKTQNLVKENLLLQQKLKEYKQEMKRTLVNQGTKNFKDTKIKRCFECYLRTDLDEESEKSGKLCGTCRRYYHLKGCFQEHKEWCKERQMSKAGRPKTKKGSVNHPNNINKKSKSSNFDYFD